MTSSGKPVSYETVIDRLYGDRDAPDTSRIYLSTLRKRVRKKLAIVDSSFTITLVWDPDQDRTGPRAGRASMVANCATAPIVIHHPFTAEQWRVLQFCVSFAEGRNPGVRERIGIPRESSR
jgi:hypothetical protein